MNQKQVIAAVARKLRGISHREVSDVLSALTEVVSQELLQPEGNIYLMGLGRLYVETQSVRNTLLFQRTRRQAAPKLRPRYYFRFSPTKGLRARLVRYRSQQEATQ
jgi:nucleoid DNA-binding protein